MSPDGYAPISALELKSAIPLFLRGVCPFCESSLGVVARGCYSCGPCDVVYANDRGYTFPALHAEELIQEALEEITTTANIPTPIPSELDPPIDASGFSLCPRCGARLTTQGDCSKCGWSPSAADRLWESVVDLLKPSIGLITSGPLFMEFDIGGETCKLFLEEARDGKFEARLVNVTTGDRFGIVGRPKAILNRIIEKLGIQPVHQVNGPPVNSHITEAGRRLSIRASGAHTTGGPPHAWRDLGDNPNLHGRKP